MKALVATIVLIVLVLLGVLINRRSIAPSQEDLVEVESQVILPAETAPATTTASSTEII